MSLKSSLIIHKEKKKKKEKIIECLYISDKDTVSDNELIYIRDFEAVQKTRKSCLSGVKTLGQTLARI